MLKGSFCHCRLTLTRRGLITVALAVLTVCGSASYFPAHSLASTVVSQTVHSSAAKSMDYLPHIRPMLESNCFRCHGPKKQKGEVDFSVLNDERSVLRSRKLWKKAARAT